MPSYIPERYQSTSYAKIPVHESQVDSKQHLADENADDEGPRYGGIDRSNHIKHAYCLVVCCLLSCIIALQITIIRTRHGESSTGGFEMGFRTELEDARSAIEVLEQDFSSQIAYNYTSKDVYVESDPTDPPYVGLPSASVDAAWDELLKGQFIAMNNDEAVKYSDAFVFELDGQARLVVGVQHSLHCLNYLRKLVHVEHYGSELAHHDLGFPSFANVHRDHCIEHLRQVIMCSGDLNPTYAVQLGDTKFGSGQVKTHTCRNWSRIKEYIESRNGFSER